MPFSVRKALEMEEITVDSRDFAIFTVDLHFVVVNHIFKKHSIILKILNSLQEFKFQSIPSVLNLTLITFWT